MELFLGWLLYSVLNPEGATSLVDAIIAWINGIIGGVV